MRGSEKHSSLSTAAGSPTPTWGRGILTFPATQKGRDMLKPPESQGDSKVGGEGEFGGALVIQIIRVHMVQMITLLPACTTGRMGEL